MGRCRRDASTLARVAGGPEDRQGAPGRGPRAAFRAVLELVPRDDRTAERRLFQGVTGDRLRAAIARACTAAGVPAFSPHDLRHRRISLLHLSGVPWARIGERVGQRNLAVTANTYTHVLRRGRDRLREPREVLVDPVSLEERADSQVKTQRAGNAYPHGVSRCCHNGCDQ